MSGVAISVNVRDGASDFLKKKIDSLAPEKLAAKVGPALQDLTREHLGSLPANKKGWPSTNFYDQFVDKVQWFPAENGLVVAIFPATIHGRQVSLNQRFHGGPITPKTAKFLAIPISPVSYGKVPSDFPGLFLLKTKKGAYLVQSGEQDTPKGRSKTKRSRDAGGNFRRRRQAKLNFLFKLKASVNQKPDPAVVPSEDEYRDKAHAAIEQNWRNN